MKGRRPAAPRWTCAHCGRTKRGYKESIMRDGRGTSTALCHPSDAGLPDCYRRVIVYKEPVGALKGVRDAGHPLPRGVEHIRGAQR